MDDARRILVLRGLRAFAYGFTSVLIGVYLADNYSAIRAGAILTSTLGGSALLTAVLGSRGHVLGRRRSHVALSVAMAGSMVVFSFSGNFVLLLIAAVSGTVAAAALESGPFVALEQAMLPHAVPEERRNRWFGRYTAVAAIVELDIVEHERALARDRRKDQTYNTPALATVFLMVQQVEWMLENGGLEWAASRSDRSAETMYGWAEASAVARPMPLAPPCTSRISPSARRPRSNTLLQTVK